MTQEPRERVAVLTGATSGIGRAAAREIARGSSRASYDEAVQRRLWGASEDLTGVRW